MCKICRHHIQLQIFFQVKIILYIVRSKAYFGYISAVKLTEFFLFVKKRIMNGEKVGWEWLIRDKKAPKMTEWGK